MNRPYVKQLRKLLYWMEERQRIYLARQAGLPAPWTSDPILQRFRFCNVFREQDKQTVWLREHWREPYKDHPNLWFACAMFRMLNLADTCEEVGFPERWEPANVVNILEHRVKRGLQVFNGAYLIRSLRNGKGVKPYSIVWDVLNPLWLKHEWIEVAFDAEKELKNRGELQTPITLKEIHEWFMQFKGWGAFMAYEVVTDLRRTRYLCDAPDIATWANAGPGAKRGLNRLYQRPVRQGLNADKALDEMRGVLAWLKCERNPNLLPVLEMRDVEHSLCELDKYCRAEQALAAHSRVGLDLFRFNNKLV